MPSSRARVAVLVKRSSYRFFVEEGQDARIVDLIAKNDPTVSRMRRSHEAHQETMRELRAAFVELGVEATYHEGPRTRIDGAYDLVLTVGGDGTVLAASHQLGPNTPLLGVNSAPDSSVGFFCGAKKGNVAETLRAALSGALKGTTLTRMAVLQNDRVLHNRVLNEALFCHASPAATSRYILRLVHGNGAVDEEEQKSSGLWVGPPAGSTAAQRSAGGRIQPLRSRKLQFVVREPYLGADVTTRFHVGLIDETAHLELLNKMRHAKLFLDGHHDVHDVEIGDRVVMRRSDESITILGLARPQGAPSKAGPPEAKTPRSASDTRAPSSKKR
jgi:NAD+ kinase